jgi:anti-anti-sigma regulatory factor
MSVWEKLMLGVHIDKIGNMAVVECEGRIVRSESAFRLREAVISQLDAQIIVIDLSEVTAVEGGGLGMLVFLQRWTFDHDIQFKLFNPRTSVLNRLERANSMQEFDIATLHEMLALLESAQSRYTLAA